MNIHQDKVIELIEHLRGSCLSKDQAVYDIFGDEVDWTDFPEEVIDEIDEAIFYCTSCGWWYDIEELEIDLGNQICYNCYNEEHEEEE